MSRANMPNRAQQIQTALGLTETEAGRLFTGNTKNPYAIWHRWCNTGNWPAPVDSLFAILQTLIDARDNDTPGASKALEHILDRLNEN